MSDEERETKPFKFVTGMIYRLPTHRPSTHGANLKCSGYAQPSRIRAMLSKAIMAVLVLWVLASDVM
jgi:hypothetical protein